MSAIAKPLIHSAGAIGGEDTVNIEKVITMSTVDRQGIENQKDEVLIDGFKTSQEAVDYVKKKWPKSKVMKS